MEQKMTKIAVLFDGACQMCCVRGRLEQMHGLHQPVERVKRHQHRIGRIPARDDRIVGIVDDLVDYIFEAVPRLSEIHHTHGNGSLRVVLLVAQV